MPERPICHLLSAGVGASGPLAGLDPYKAGTPSCVFVSVVTILPGPESFQCFVCPEKLSRGDNLEIRLDRPLRRVA